MDSAEACPSAGSGMGLSSWRGTMASSCKGSPASMASLAARTRVQPWASVVTGFNDRSGLVQSRLALRFVRASRPASWTEPMCKVDPAGRPKIGRAPLTPETVSHFFPDEEASTVNEALLRCSQIVGGSTGAAGGAGGGRAGASGDAGVDATAAGGVVGGELAGGVLAAICGVVGEAGSVECASSARSSNGTTHCGVSISTTRISGLPRSHDRQMGVRRMRLMRASGSPTVRRKAPGWRISNWWRQLPFHGVIEALAMRASRPVFCWILEAIQSRA